MKRIGKNAFTLVELIMVIAIIGILMAGMTMYLGNQGQKAKIIEAEGCANVFNGQLNNQVFDALTSKIINKGTNSIPPDFYLIQLSGGNSTNEKNCTTANTGIFCNKLIFRYATLSGINQMVISENYDKEITNEICHMGNTEINFYWSGNNDLKYIRMNKGFSPIIGTDITVFGIATGEVVQNSDALNGDIIINACFSRGGDGECIGYKQIGKRSIDARSQTIGYKKCKLYSEELDICEVREA